MKKVYCKDCEHVRSCDHGHFCYTGEIKSTYYSPGVEGMCRCEVKNKNNDCPDYVEKIYREEMYSSFRRPIKKETPWWAFWR